MNTPPRGEDKARDERAAELPFQRLGHYRILSRIGGQGTADVYKGHDESLDRPVAIKVLPSHLAGRDDVVRRFHAEAAASAKVVHPNVVAIHFVGQEDGHHFFAMQYVDGQSLAQRITQSAPLESTEVLEIIEQCLLGLEAAHRQGLIHWGIKPGNILLDSAAGHVVLVDFGLARRVEQPREPTADDVLLGTVDYLAPEQARQEQADTRADIYSLGAVAFQALSGRLPFEADTPMAMVFQHAYEPPLLLEELVPEIAEPIRDLVARMMAKDRADRYQSCGEVLADLRALRESESAAPVAAKPTAASPEKDVPTDLSIPGEIPVWIRLRNWARSYCYRGAPEFVKNAQDTVHQVDGALAHYNGQRNRLSNLRREARSVIGELSVQIRANLEVTADAEQALDSTDGTDEQDSFEQRRAGWAEQVEALRRHRQEQQRIVEDLGQQLVEADSRLAQLRGRRDVLLGRLSAAKARCVKEGGRLKPSFRPLVAPLILAVIVVLAGPRLWQRFGPSSQRWINRDLINSAEQLRAADFKRLEDERIRALRQLNRDNLRKAEIAAAKKRLEAEAARKSSATPPTTPGETPSPAPDHPAVEVSKYHRAALTGHTDRVESVAFSPDGLVLASAGRDKTVRLWDAATGSLVKTLEGHADEVLAVAFSPDGSILASMSKSQIGENIRHRKRTLILWDPAEGKPLHTMQVSAEQLEREFVELIHSDTARPDDYGGDSYTLAFSPDGSVLASSGEAFSVRLWDTATGQLSRSVEKFKLGVRNDRVGHRSEVCCLAFSGDGTALLSSGWEERVLWWDTQAEYQPLANRYLHIGGADDATVWSMAISPDESILALAVGDHTAQLWQLSDLTRLRTLIHHTDRVRSVAFSPDGSLLAVAGDDGDLSLWDVAQGESRGVLTGHLGPVRSVVFSPDGSSIASAGWDQTVRLWNLPEFVEEPRTVIVMLEPPASDPAAKGELLDDEVARFVGHTDAVLDVRFMPDGKRVISAGADGTVRLWEIATGREVRRFTGYAGPVWGLDVSSDGGLLVCGDGAGDLVFLDIETGEELRRASGHEGQIRCVRICQYAQFVASGGEDGSVRVWHMETAVEISSQYAKAPINAISISPMRQVMATVSTEKAVEQWGISKSNDRPEGGFYSHTETVNCCTHFPERHLLGKAFSSSGNVGENGKDFEIALWEAYPGGRKSLRKYVGHTAAPWGLDCSSDGTFLVSGAADKTVRVWHVSFAREMYRFEGHTAAVRPVALSPDDSLVVSGGADQTVRVWRIPDLDEILAVDASPMKPRTPPGAVVLLTFEKDRIIARGEQFLVEDLSPAGSHFSGTGEVPGGEGKAGLGMDLEGFQLQLPRTPIDDGSQYTVTAWVFLRQRTERFVIYSEETSETEDSSQRPVRRISVSSDGSLEVEFFAPAGEDGPAPVQTPAGSVPKGRWHFLAVRSGLDSSGNSELALSINQSTFFFPSPAVAGSGESQVRLGPGDGIIDEVAVFGRKLTDKELRSLYEMGVGGLGLSK